MDPVRVLLWFMLVMSSMALLEILRRKLTGFLRRSWISVPAVVTKVYVDGVHIESENPVTVYKPVIEYEYDYHGLRHSGSRVSYENLNNIDIGEVGSYVTGINVGDAVDVYVKPGNPSVSVLYPFVTEDLISPTILAILFFMIALAGILDLW